MDAYSSCCECPHWFCGLKAHFPLQIFSCCFLLCCGSAEYFCKQKRKVPGFKREKHQHCEKSEMVSVITVHATQNLSHDNSPACSWRAEKEWANLGTWQGPAKVRKPHWGCDMPYLKSQRTTRVFLPHQHNYLMGR